jgi:outer membrane protein assembly factor BamD (BamD/ComL family)
VPSVKGAGGKTLQREAADAVASGAYGRAAELYDQLAKQYPNKPAYAEAAAILRTKAGLR